MQFTESEAKLTSASEKGFRNSLSSFFKKAEQKFVRGLDSCVSAIERNMSLIGGATKLAAGIAITCVIVSGFSWKGYIGMRLANSDAPLGRMLGTYLMMDAVNDKADKIASEKMAGMETAEDGSVIIRVSKDKVEMAEDGSVIVHMDKKQDEKQDEKPAGLYEAAARKVAQMR